MGEGAREMEGGDGPSNAEWNGPWQYVEVQLRKENNESSRTETKARQSGDGNVRGRVNFLGPGKEPLPRHIFNGRT